MNLRKVVLAAVAALAAGCTEGVVGPTTGTRSGELELLLTVPTGDRPVRVGALSISITGGTTESVASPVGLQVFTQSSGSTTQVILVGNVVSGPVARFTIPDRSQAASYVVEITGAAASRSYDLLSFSDFTLTLRSTSLPR